MNDLISREVAKEKYRSLLETAKELGTYVSPDFLDFIPTVKPDMAQVLAYESGKASERPLEDGWIPIVTRPLTEEEKEEYPDYTCIYECPMPDDGEEVLVSTKWGVSTDTYYVDPDGCYFENYCDEGDVLAWQSKPKPYEGGKDNE